MVTYDVSEDPDAPVHHPAGSWVKISKAGSFYEGDIAYVREVDRSTNSRKIALVPRVPRTDLELSFWKSSVRQQKRLGLEAHKKPLRRDICRPSERPPIQRLTFAAAMQLYPTLWNFDTNKTPEPPIFIWCPDCDDDDDIQSCRHPPSAKRFEFLENIFHDGLCMMSIPPSYLEDANEGMDRAAFTGFLDVDLHSTNWGFEAMPPPNDWVFEVGDTIVVDVTPLARKNSELMKLWESEQEKQQLRFANPAYPLSLARNGSLGKISSVQGIICEVEFQEGTYPVHQSNMYKQFDLFASVLLPGHLSPATVVAFPDSHVVRVIVDGGMDLDFESNVLRRAPLVEDSLASYPFVPVGYAATDVGAIYHDTPNTQLWPATHAELVNDFLTPPAPWVGTHVSIQKGHYKGIKGTVKNVKVELSTTSGLSVEVELNVIGPSAGKHWMDFDILRREM